MKVYIYKPKETEFSDDWLYAADKGFKGLGAKPIYFEDVTTIPYAPDTVVVGFIEDTRTYFNLHQIEYPKPLNIPEQLNREWALGREVTNNVSIEEIQKMKGPLFIKPCDNVKEFAAGVIENPSKLTSLGIYGDANALVSETIDMESEYRCFIYNKELVGMKHYQGNFSKFPKMGVVNSMIKNYTDAPIAYSLDVAVCKNSIFDTVLVECNDFWSICNYGLDPVIYAKMLRDRWFQLTKYRNF